MLEVVGVVREISINFKNKGISFRYCPFKPMDISSSKTQFALPDFQKKLMGIFLLKTANDIGSSIRGTVVNNENVEILIQRKNGFHYSRNILLFIIGWYDGYLFQYISGG